LLLNAVGTEIVHRRLLGIPFLIIIFRPVFTAHAEMPKTNGSQPSINNFCCHPEVLPVLSPGMFAIRVPGKSAGIVECCHSKGAPNDFGEG
jgi:hypothetical protein